MDFSKKTKKIKRNPCLKQPHVTVKVKVKDEDRSVWSLPTLYNNYNVDPKIEDLYSGLLKKQIIEQTCKTSVGQIGDQSWEQRGDQNGDQSRGKSKDKNGDQNKDESGDQGGDKSGDQNGDQSEDQNGEVFSIPDELSKCVKNHTKRRRTSNSIHFTFTIVDPKDENENKMIEKTFKIDEDCAHIVNASSPNLNEGNNQTEPPYESISHIKDTEGMMMTIIIGASVLVVVIVIVVVTCLLCFRKKKQKKESKSRQADRNPVYDGDLDYVYDDMGNYDTMEESTRGKKTEVKDEVVDRSSIYGEKEEGWENAVVVDENPNYEG